MVTPYDWQEGIGHRAAYVESRLAGGSPVLALSLSEGILLFTLRRQVRKLYEVYDRLAFSAIGQQSDVESLRVAAIDFAHQEGYQRSEQDVTVQRVASALSQPLKRAFADFNTSPFVVRSIFCEVAAKPEGDTYYVLDYDGDYSVRKRWAFVAGSEEAAQEIRSRMNALEPKGLSISDAIEKMKPIWAAAVDPSGTKDFASLSASLELETALLERVPKGESGFRLIS